MSKLVKMTQAMASPRWSIVAGDVVKVSDEVAVVWVEGGVATLEKYQKGDYCFDHEAIPLEVVEDVELPGPFIPPTEEAKSETNLASESSTGNGAGNLVGGDQSPPG